MAPGHLRQDDQLESEDKGAGEESEQQDDDEEEVQEEDQTDDTFSRRDSELPALPIGDHSMFSDGEHSLAGRSDAPSDGGSMDERELRRHFMDVESSFLPDVAPVQTQEGGLGVDDTYLELGKPGRTPPPDEMFRSARKSQRFAEEPTVEPETPADAYKTPGLGLEDDVEDDEEAGDHSPSSPAEAAAYRTHARILPAVSATDIIPTRTASDSARSDISSRNDSRRSTPSARPTSKGSTVRPGSSRAPQDIPLPTDHSSLLNFHSDQSEAPSRLNVRPTFSKSRQMSEYSSISTTTMGSDLSGSDTYVDADYALQTGGAMSSGTTGRSSRPLDILTRLPSLGSVVSYIGRDSEGVPSLTRGVSIHPLSNRLTGGLDGLEEEQPETPRASAHNIEAPTDTALAQRVESIHVPETVARDFRARTRSPVRSTSPGPSLRTQERPRTTLTLKEQNSKIDKLTKENFDLKLKIHFLDQALQSRSDDGVKELIDKNVQLQTDLANERKETQTLRRRMRELERKAQDQEDGLAEALKRKAAEDDESRDVADDPTLQAEMHEEILYLRQQLDYSENQVTTLREEVMTKELERRKMGEHVRSMAGTRGEETAGMKETMDMWQDLLHAETGRREQAEEDIRKLREELTALRIEHASPAASKVFRRRGQPVYEPSVSEDTDFTNGVTGTTTGSSATLVGQLKHENAELRRDLGAQTSMLTSRNRERERLQQEIEDLKLLQRKSDGGRSVAGESIFERSISRAHQRAPSRASEHTHVTHVTEAERDDWEKKEGQLRDHNAELKLRFQELERTHKTHLEYVSALEGDFQQMEGELNEAAEDLRALQSERDEALHAFEEKEAEYEKLEQEALGEIDKLMKDNEALDEQGQEARRKHQRVQAKLEHTTDDYKGLQAELREITQGVMNLEDEKQANMRNIQTLEQQLAEAEEEIQKWEQKCKELDQKNRKLEITQESLHSEITFLREEQESDKIKIGELEDALNAAQQTIQDEQEKLHEMEHGVIEERQQRDVLENQSKEEVQKVLDDLNAENGQTKDEARKLRRALSAKEVEASTWKQKLDELEQSLRQALREPNGTKQSLLAEIERVQRELESTANTLDRARMDIADKDRLLRHRDGLLESTSLESRRLSDLLDKERASRKHDLDQFERATRGQATHMREITQHQSRVLDLESKYSQDKRKMAALEQQLRDQLAERNGLLLALWNRLSTLCGLDWAQSNGLVNGETPSVEVIGRTLPAFNKNILSAVKTIESLIGGFKVRIRSIEKDLSRDYQTLEHNLDLRIRQMDGMEKAVQDAQRAFAEEQAAAARRPQAKRTLSTKSIKGGEEISKLKNEVKLLKVELKFHRQHPSPMAQQLLNNQQAQLSPDNLHRQSSAGAPSSSTTGKSQASPARSMMAQLLNRAHSSSVVEQVSTPRDEMTNARPPQQPIVLSTPPIQPSEQRWVHRLKEMERRLKAEREARLLDRRGARQRLEEAGLQNEELKLRLEREKIRRGSLAESSVAGSESRQSEVSMEGDRV